MISRAIHANPALVCAPDPFIGYFRMLRHDILAQAYGNDFDSSAPFSDFFLTDKPDLDVFLDATLDLPVSFSMAEARERIQPLCESNAPVVTPNLDMLQGATYRELYESLLSILRKTYATGETQSIGFVQGWVEAYAGAIQRAFPENPCIHIIRDPRSVIASWKRSTDLTHNYPFLMMVRHWRKSAAIASLFKARSDKYLVVRYEDFVNQPQDEAGKICQFLGVPFSEAMLQVGSFQDGAGKKWKSNTSYEETPEVISQKFRDSWKDRLTEEETRLIEELCAPEMKWMGYARETDSVGPDPLLSPVDIVRTTQTDSTWVSGFQSEFTLGSANISKELVRWFIWNNGAKAARTLPVSLLKRAFLNPELAFQERGA